MYKNLAISRRGLSAMIESESRALDFVSEGEQIERIDKTKIMAESEFKR